MPGEPAPMSRPRALLLIGPTAVGKSAAALRVAEAVGGEIVSLDSRQMVRGLDAGTAKPTAEQRSRVPHHLVDVVAPDDSPSLSKVLAWTYAAVDDILARGRRPLLVGGTGQYVRAIREGWQVPAVPPNPDLRAALEAVAARDGHETLHAQLAAVDPATAARIDARNVRRVVRALEVHTYLGRPASEVRAQSRPRYDLGIIGLIRPRPELYARIDARIDAMLAAGLEEEVRSLVAEGYGWKLPAMSSLGYGEWRDYFAGELGRDEVVRRIRHNTRRLVRTQATWFRADDAGIRWFDVSAAAADDAEEGSGSDQELDPVAAVVAWAATWFEASAAVAGSREPPGTTGVGDAGRPSIMGR